MTSATPHLLMSVSKSIVGCVAGILVGRRVSLDPARRRHARTCPRSRGPGTTGPRSATCSTCAPAWRSARATSEPDVRGPGDGALDGMAAPLETATRPACTSTSRPSARPAAHGGDVHLPVRRHRHARLGLRARGRDPDGGSRLELLWVPMGAEHDADITCDPVGIGRSTTAASARSPATSRGSARCCSMTARRRPRRSSQPTGWPTRAARPADVRQAFATTDNESVLPGGWYRNQFWFVPEPARGRPWSASGSTARWSTSTTARGPSA